jgi:hypothetical protein
MYIAIFGIAAEIFGFWLIIKSSRKLDFRGGDFVSDRYVDPRTGEPLPRIEGPPDPRMYRPGIYIVVGGLATQIVDILATQVFKLPY